MSPEDGGLAGRMSHSMPHEPLYLVGDFVRRDGSHSRYYVPDQFRLAEAYERLQVAAHSYVTRMGVHHWRCEFRTAAKGWKPGEPPVIECQCGLDELIETLGL